MTTLILCRTREVPTPEEIAASLCQSGYEAFVEVKSSPLASIAAEIRYAANRMPIVIRYGSDFVDEPESCDLELWLLLQSTQRNRPKTPDLSSLRQIALLANKKARDTFREKLLAEFVANDAERSRVRRFIYINAIENADKTAL